MNRRHPRAADDEKGPVITMPLPRPCTYRVAGRTAGSGPVLAVFTDGPADMAVAAHAASLAAHTRTLLVAAAAVHVTGLNINPILRGARTRRVHADRTAIIGRVTPILHAAGVAHLSTTLLVPTGTDALRALPLPSVHQLINRFSAVTVVTAHPLHDPTGMLQRVSHPHLDVPATATAPVASAWPATTIAGETPAPHLASKGMSL